MLRPAFPSLFALVLAGCLFTDAEVGERGAADTSAEESEDDGDTDGGDTGDTGDDGGEDDGDGEDGGDQDDCKIEDEAIGQTVSLEIGGGTVTFTDWVVKDDSPGEFVGFTLQLDGLDAISYKVKAGGDVFPSTALTWIHPNGTTGPEVSAISNVDVCEDDGGEDDGGEDDGGEDDGGEDDGGDIIVD